MEVPLRLRAARWMLTTRRNPVSISLSVSVRVAVLFRYNQTFCSAFSAATPSAVTRFLIYSGYDGNMVRCRGKTMPPRASRVIISSHRQRLAPANTSPIRAREEEESAKKSATCAFLGAYLRDAGIGWRRARDKVESSNCLHPVPLWLQHPCSFNGSLLENALLSR